MAENDEEKLLVPDEVLTWEQYQCRVERYKLYQELGVLHKDPTEYPPPIYES